MYLQAATPEWLSGLRPKTRWWFAFLCGAIASLANPPFGQPITAVLGVFLFLLLAPWQQPVRKAFWLGWGFGLGYFVPTFHWIIEPFLVEPLRHGWMAPFAILMLSGGLALFWAVPVAFAAWRQSAVVMVLAMGLAEFARAHVFTGFPWAMMVTTSVDNLLYQGAAWVGPFALTLLFWAVLLLASLLWKGSRPASLAVLGVMALLTVIPAPKGPAPEDDAPLLRAVQPNAAQAEKWDPDKIPIFLARKLDATSAQPTADFILWPEISLPHPLERAGPLLEVVAARAAGRPVMVGAQRWDSGDLYNSLALLSEDGTIADNYDKAHLVPFGEYMPLARTFARWGVFGLATDGQLGFSAGTGAHLTDVPGVGLVQPLLCYESVFPDNVGNTAERPQLIALSTNDAWFGQYGGPRQHLQQAQARAIEQGVPVLRSANTGISAIIDARGQILTSLELGEEGYVDHLLPPALSATPYSRWRETVFFFLVAGAVILHLLSRRRTAVRD